jgi:hypothetical protein
MFDFLFFIGLYSVLPHPECVEGAKALQNYNYFMD